MSFASISRDLQKELKSNLPQIRFLLKKNPAIGYTKITEIGSAVGKKYSIKLLVNFPQKDKINDFESYGTQDVSLIIDQKKTNFPIDRAVIKSKAQELFVDVRVQDAYMYEGKEGVKVFFDPNNDNKDRIDILPHSLHIWCKFTDKVIEYCDWLLANVYQLNQGHSSSKHDESAPQ